MSVNMTKPTAAFVRTVAEAKALKAAIAKLEAEYAVKANALRKMNGGNIGKVDTAEGSVTFSENNSYPEAAIRSRLTAGQAARCEVKKISNELVKALYPDVYAAAKDNKGVKVTLS
jgi:hypothetical protein